MEVLELFIIWLLYRWPAGCFCMFLESMRSPKHFALKGGESS
jgi:hypothetical protein